MTIDEVDTYAKSLPGVTVGVQYRNQTWAVGDKHFAWRRPFSKADLKRFGDETPPAGEVLAVMVENLDAKDALLAMALPGFFTIPHFNGYAAVLIELKKAHAKDVKAAIRDAHRVAAAKAATRKPKPAKRKNRRRTS